MKEQHYIEREFTAQHHGGRYSFNSAGSHSVKLSLKPRQTNADYYSIRISQTAYVKSDEAGTGDPDGK